MSKSSLPKDTRYCINCRRIFRTQDPSQVACSPRCRTAAEVGAVVRQKVKRKNPMPLKHRGAWAEIIAVAWLLENGYEVFKNVSAHGPVDLVAIRNRDITLIDVKMVGLEMSVGVSTLGAATVQGGVLSHDQQKAGIKTLFVSPDGFCSFNRADLAELYSAAFKTQLTA